MSNNRTPWKMPNLQAGFHLPLIPWSHTHLICVLKSALALLGGSFTASCWGGGKDGTGVWDLPWAPHRALCSEGIK